MTGRRRTSAVGHRRRSEPAGHRADALRWAPEQPATISDDELRTIEPDLGIERSLGAERIERRRRDGRAVVIKRSGRRPRAELRREATVLEALRGDDVVELVGHTESDDADELITVDAGRSSLADPWSGSSSQRSATFASACTALANLHALGWFHGAVALDHVVVASDGTVRWCSLGSAGRTDADPSGADLDRVALMRSAHRVARTLPRAQLLRRQLGRLGDRPDPRRLARIFRRWSRRRTSSAAPWVRRRSPAPEDGRPTATTSGVVGALIALALAVIVVPRSCSSGPADVDGLVGRGAAASSIPDSPAVTDGRPEVIVNGERWRVGRPDDVTLVVDRDCDGRDDLLVLRTSTGEVFDFPPDSTDHSATSTSGRRLMRVPGARALTPPANCGPPGVRRDDGSVISILAP